ncbi:hypothetical protein V6N13_142845 [Hibiscus sabdariffa]|uniref:Uncharacterized protein n=1 Tax=Hibiscus sabdariffa TaxID=183260 RepID=A0ABR2FFP3_9ROSI
MTTEEESIEQAAASRRERLKAFKAAQELLNAPDEDSAQAAQNQTEETNEEDNPSMKFRNYVPYDKQFQEGKVAPPVLPKFEDPVAATPPASEEKEVLVYLQYHVFMLHKNEFHAPNLLQLEVYPI